VSASSGGGQGSGRIVVRLGDTVVQTVVVTQQVLTIGRMPDRDLSLPHPTVSRNHAEIRLTPEGAVLTDLGSTQGTVVDGRTLLAGQPHLLADGSSFLIGPYLLTWDAADVLAQPVAEPDRYEPAPELPVAPPPPVPAVSAVPPPVNRPPRQTWPSGRLPLRPSQYLNDLPVIYQDSDFLGRFLLIFETIWEPLEHRQRHINMYFDPRTAPADFLPWLASWLDFRINPHWPEIRLRRLLAEAMELYRWRGTRYGLARMIEIHCGVFPRIVEDASQPFIFRVQLAPPAGVTIDRAMVEDVIRTHKPAHAGYILEITS
jgi:phage tail-like protein